MTITITPTVPSPATDTQVMSVDVVDSVGNLVHVAISVTAQDGGDGRPEFVFDNVRAGAADFLGPYDNVSAVFNQISAQHWVISFKRTGGWSSMGNPNNSFRVAAQASNNAGTTANVNSFDFSIDPDPFVLADVAFTPADASLVTASDSIRVEVSSDSATLDQVRILATFPDRTELVLEGDVSGPPTAVDPYNLVDTGGITNGRFFVFERGDGGWPDDFTVTVAANTDQVRTQYTDEQSSYVRSPPATAADTTEPTVGSVVPAPGTPIATTDPLQFDVTDDSGAFRRILVVVNLAGTQELAHDGNNFLGNYAGGSCSRTAISGGFRFVILRDGGWPSSPTIRVFAIDQSGNEA